MAELVVDLDLNPWQREAAARAYAQTFHMAYESAALVGPNHDTDSCVKPSCPTKSPAAMALRGLVDGLRSAGPVRVKLPQFGRGDWYRLSALLEQTASRPGREGNGELGQALSQVWAGFDRTHKLSQNELDRTEHLDLDAAEAEKKQAARESARLAAVRDGDRGWKAVR